MDGDASLRLRVLGELAATRDGAVVDLGGRRQRAVLAALVVMRDQVVPAERLVDCVWGDHPPANGTAAIQAYVSHLRRRLQPEAVARHRDGSSRAPAPGYVLRLAPETVDAWCFERAVDRAAALAPADAVRTLDDALRAVAGRRLRRVRRRAVGRGRGRPAHRAARRGPGAPARGAAAAGRRCRCSSVSSRRWSPRTRCARSGGGSWRWRSTAPSGRPMRWRRCAGPARPWPTSSASTRARRCGPSRPRCSPSRRPSTRPPRTRPRCDLPGRAEVVRDAGARRRPDLVDRARETAALRRVVDDAGRRDVRLRARRGTRGHRQDAAAGRGHPPRHRRRGRGCCRRGAASWSSPSASVRCGSCSSPASSDPDRRDALLGGAAGRAAAVFDEVAGDDAGAARQLRRPARALLADRQPHRRRAGGALRRRRPVVRQRVAALPRLPGQAARGAARARRARACAPASRIPTTRCSPRSRSTRRSTVLRPRTAVGGGGRRRWSGSGSARARTPSSTPATG